MTSREASRSSAAAGHDGDDGSDNTPRKPRRRNNEGGKAAQKAETVQKMIDVMKNRAGVGLTRKDLQQQIGYTGMLTSEYWEDLTKNESVVVRGKGRRGDPFTYRWITYRWRSAQMDDSVGWEPASAEQTALRTLAAGTPARLEQEHADEEEQHEREQEQDDGDEDKAEKDREEKEQQEDQEKEGQDQEDDQEEDPDDDERVHDAKAEHTIVEFMRSMAGDPGRRDIADICGDIAVKFCHTLDLEDGLDASQKLLDRARPGGKTIFVYLKRLANRALDLGPPGFVASDADDGAAAADGMGDYQGHEIDDGGGHDMADSMDDSYTEDVEQKDEQEDQDEPAEAEASQLMQAASRTALPPVEAPPQFSADDVVPDSEEEASEEEQAAAAAAVAGAHLGTDGGVVQRALQYLGEKAVGNVEGLTRKEIQDGVTGFMMMSDSHWKMFAAATTQHGSGTAQTYR